MIFGLLTINVYLLKLNIYFSNTHTHTHTHTQRHTQRKTHTHTHTQNLNLYLSFCLVNNIIKFIKQDKYTEFREAIILENNLYIFSLTFFSNSHVYKFFNWVLKSVSKKVK